MDLPQSNFASHRMFEFAPSSAIEFVKAAVGIVIDFCHARAPMAHMPDTGWTEGFAHGSECSSARHGDWPRTVGSRMVHLPSDPTDLPWRKDGFVVVVVETPSGS